MPILIAGLLFKHAIEGSLRNLWITVTVLALFGVLLWVVDARSKQVKTMKEMTWKDALIFGIGQMLALIPAFPVLGAPSPLDAPWDTPVRQPFE